MKQTTKSIQMWDGKWYRLGLHEFHECCNCGLVHEVTHKIERGVVFERWRVDKRETRRARTADPQPKRARKRAK